MTAVMNPGARLRFVGPAGAEFVVTVGVAFDAATIARRVASGEWRPVLPAAPDPVLPRPAVRKK